MRTPAKNGWVLYDGSCAFCTRWVQFWGPMLRRRGFEIDELQADWVSEALHLDPEESLQDIRLLTPRGEVVSGSDVYLHVTKKIWWAWPFGALFSQPGFNLAIRAGYRWFARNRYCISGKCNRVP